MCVVLYIMRLYNYFSLLFVQRPAAQLKAIKAIQLFPLLSEAGINGPALDKNLFFCLITSLQVLISLLGGIKVCHQYVSHDIKHQMPTAPPHY